MSCCSYSCDNGRSCSRSDASSDFTCTGPYMSEGTVCHSTSFCGRDGNGHEYAYISMDGSICSRHDVLTATAVLQGDPTGILAVAIRAIQGLGYLGPESFKIQCAMEYIEHKCRLPNVTHACFASGGRELKLPIELMKSYEGDQEKIQSALESQFSFCTRPGQKHICHKTGSPMRVYSSIEQQLREEAQLAEQIRNCNPELFGHH